MTLRHINHQLQAWDPLRRRILETRLNLGLTQDEIAEDAGLSSRTTLGRIERGESTPGVDTLLALTHALGLEVVLVPPNLARLLALDESDIVSLVRAATAAASQPLVLPDRSRDKVASALDKLSSRAGAR